MRNSPRGKYYSITVEIASNERDFLNINKSSCRLYERQEDYKHYIKRHYLGYSVKHSANNGIIFRGCTTEKGKKEVIGCALSKRKPSTLPTI